MYLSARNKFRYGDPGWDNYIKFIALPQLQEVRTVDGGLNERVSPAAFEHCALAELEQCALSLPAIDPSRSYYQLAVNLTEEPQPTLDERFLFLGYDLSDETRTSSVLNCGPWEGELQSLTKNLNQFGLLNLATAQLAQESLPSIWGEEEPHAFVDIWALFEYRLYNK